MKIAQAYRLLSISTLFLRTLGRLFLIFGAIMTSQAAGWQIVPSRDTGNLGNHLYGVATLGTDDAWAVGDYNDGPYNYFARTLTEHWDGQRWNVVPSPNPLTGDDASDILRAVVAVSPGDVWAVGSYSDLSGVNEQTLILHWDGSQWVQVHSPNPQRVSYLYGITAVSSSDIWAVGYQSDAESQAKSGSLTLHWNGLSWTIVPNPGESNLTAVTAVSSTDIWAVSESSEFLHWDGTSWTVFYGPQRYNGYLEAVAAISSDDVWAVGYQQVIYNQNTVTLHWNGRQWNLVDAIDPQDEAGFYGVTALSSNSVWAVGFQSGRPLVEKWNGRRWTLVTTPSAGTFPTFQAAAIVPGSGNVWAVGWDYQHTNVARTLAELSAP